MRDPTSARGRGGAPHRCMGTRCAPAGAARRYSGNGASCTVLPWAADAIIASVTLHRVAARQARRRVGASCCWMARLKASTCRV